MTTTDIDITEIAAEHAIRRALARYCRGVDRGDREMLASAYWPDAHDDHGNFKGNPADFAKYISDRFDVTPRVGQHHITNVYFVVDGTTAHVESYFIAFNAQLPEAGGEHDLVTGRYLDRFEQRAGEWRIADRTVVVDIARDAIAGAAWPRLDAFALGGRGEADPSAAFFA
jgi:ketosteroid isomerase-like protein